MNLRIVVLGGGTAGWIAACLMKRRWPQHMVAVVESADIGIIGVGEGSTPQLKALFDALGIAEQTWMPRCNATYKAGIAFHGWSARPGHASYFHPFASALDQHTAPQFYFHTRARRTGRDVWAHPDRFFVPARLAAERRAPLAPDHFPFAMGYGYHFDATLVGRFLRDHAVAKLGVVHLERTVTSVAVDGDGRVTHLGAEGGEAIAGDLFVDASGFAAVIARGALGEPFRPFAENLFNDRAIAVPTPRAEGTLPCATRATALSAGWAWSIPLTNRTGNGYVYASRYLAPDAAEAELRAHLGLAADQPVRHLAMNVGRLERSWVSNCLAVGLAQGFIEPLEATALHVVQATVEGFIDAFEAGGFAAGRRDAFNASIAARIEGIRDYIVAHYRLNGRRDTAYWRDAASLDCLSDSLKGVITAWFTGRDLGEEIARQDIARYYAPLSWHCLLAGYGCFPEDAKLRPPEPGLAVSDMAAIDRFVAGCASNFPDHDVALGRHGGVASH